MHGNNLLFIHNLLNTLDLLDLKGKVSKELISKLKKPCAGEESWNIHSA